MNHDSLVSGPSLETADRRKFNRIFFGLLIVLLLSSLDSSILNTSLPRIAADLGDLSRLSWVVSSFMLTSILSTPIYGKLVDRYGGKLVLCAAIGLFLLGSMLCGFARNLPELALYRGIQGLGAGGLTALAQVMIADLVGPEKRAQYQGFFSATAAVSNIGGPLIGGGITVYLSWRWIFYINLPLGLLALALIMFNLKSLPGRTDHPLDYRGMAYLSLTTLPALVYLSLGGIYFDWLSMAAAALLAASLVFGMAFFRREASSATSFLGLHLLRDGTFLASSGAAIWLGFATMGVNVYMPLWFQVVHGMDPIQSGLMLLPKIIAMMLSALIGVRVLLQRYAYKTVISLGLALEVVAVTGITTACYAGAPPWVFQVCLAVMGSGMGIAWPNIVTLLQNRVDRRDLGTATSAITFLRALGGAVGVAFAGAIVASWPNLGDAAGPSGHILSGAEIGNYRWVLSLVFALLSAGMLAALHSVLVLLPKHAPRTSN